MSVRRFDRRPRIARYLHKKNEMARFAVIIPRRHSSASTFQSAKSVVGTIIVSSLIPLLRRSFSSPVSTQTRNRNRNPDLALDIERDNQNAPFQLEENEEVGPGDAFARGREDDNYS